MGSMTAQDSPFFSLRPRHQAIKRACDVPLSLLAIIVLLPVMALTALAIKTESRGPLIFRQRRHGLNGEIFEIYKFRSMTAEASANDTLEQVYGGDRRVTRTGWLIRRSGLDELPQLFNVLRGDMSLIGPRPHAVEHNDYYAVHIPGYHGRHTTRPGITGLAQVRGLRGATPTVEIMARRVAADLEYIRTWSLWLDMKILWQTLFVIFSQERR